MTVSNPNPTLIPGLRSPYDQTGGIVYLGRMLDKIGLHAQGLLPADWANALGFAYPTSFDSRCCRFLSIGYPPDLQEEAVKTALAQAELLCAEWV